jgi:hypothetical protein
MLRDFNLGLYSITFLLRELIYYYITLINIVTSILKVENSTRYYLPIEVSLILYFL